MAMTRPARGTTTRSSPTREVIAMATKPPTKTTTRTAPAAATQRPTKPQDRKKSANQARAEAAAKGVTFVYDDVEYTVGPEAATDLELLEAVEDQRYIAACRGYLGRQQWEAFKDTYRDPSGRVDMSNLEGLLQELMDALGNS